LYVDEAVYELEVPYFTKESAAGFVVQEIVAAVASGVPEEMALMTGTWMTDTDVVAVVVPFAFVAVRV
jgi:hypothetical protein